MSNATGPFPNKKKPSLAGSIITLLALASLGYFLIHLASIREDTPEAVYGVDFIAYYTAALLVRSGNAPAIYAEMTDDFSVVDKGIFYETARKSGFHGTPTRYVYLPLFLLPFTWFTHLSFATASYLWLLVNIAALFSIILLQWHITKALSHPFLRLMVIISLNLFSFPLIYGLKLGQTSLLVYLAVCLIYCLFNANRDALAGIVLGLITALKFSPLLFVLYFLYRKKYRLALSAATTVLALLALSVALYGLTLHKLYWNYLGTISGMGIAAWSNQSIEALLLRVFHAAGIFSFAPIHLTTSGTLLRYAIALAVIGTVYLFLRRTPGTQRAAAYPLEFSALILCFLIIPPISWLHYFTVANLAVLLTVSYCLQISHPRSAFVVAVSITGYAMIAFHPNYSYLTALLGQGYAAKLLVSLPLIGSCLLLCLNLALINRKQSSAMTDRGHAVNV